MVLETNNGADTSAVGPVNRHDRRDAVAVDTASLLQIDERDGAPTYIQLERRVRIAVAHGVLKPGDTLPSVCNLAGQHRQLLQLDSDNMARGRPAWRSSGCLERRDSRAKPTEQPRSSLVELIEARELMQRAGTWVHHGSQSCVSPIDDERT